MKELFSHIKEIGQYGNMIANLARRELVGKYQRSFLGFIWSFLSPLFHILVYYIVFTYLIPNKMENYIIYLMTGMIPWTFFSTSMSGGARSICMNPGMVKKIYFPREALTLGGVTAKVVDMLLSFCVMTVFLIFTKVGFSEHLILLPLVVLINFAFALGVALFVAAITVYFQDMLYIIDVITMAWMWGTPILYTVDKAPDWIKNIVNLNPMTLIIRQYRAILLYHWFPDTAIIIKSAIIAICTLVVGEVVFFRLSKRFAEEL